jgi:hypothetical protein
MIDIVRVDEHGTEISRNMDVGVVDEALHYAGPDGRCLAFIDPYGDTTFNQGQLPVLVAEFRALKARISDDELRSRIDQLVLLIQLALDRPHEYIQFVGD